MQPDKRIVFDVETQKEFAEVGGYRNVHMLGVSVAGVYNYADDSYRAYEEKELPELEKTMAAADLIIGFNTKHFDYQVLQPYFNSLALAQAPTLDLMEKLEAALGYRPGLDALARATLGEQKSSHGLEALKWFREGKIDEIKKYCLQDVKLTKDIYEYGLNHGSVLFESRVSGLQTVPASWSVEKDKKDIKIVLSQAFKNKQMVEIDYVSMKAEDGEEARKKRNIEIYSMNGDTIEAFCHTRQDKRYFKMYRILNAKTVDLTPQRPSLF
ncbi:MAG: ribonuclease H-like domain-containing protein [Patescibacteria group bacterium]